MFFLLQIFDTNVNARFTDFQLSYDCDRYMHRLQSPTLSIVGLKTEEFQMLYVLGSLT